VKYPLVLNVNGNSFHLEVEPPRRLIDVLRDDLGLTGTKEGCSIGVCGACTVLVDGQVLSACLTLALTISGREVQTIEGLARNGELHPLQKAFITSGGFQCGYCTPGQIMAASALLNHHPSPSDEELKEAMLGNLCRCTGYYKIMDAIRTAAAEMAAPGAPR
jgi:carbon-monoxide dehydrogenase small subunit